MEWNLVGRVFFVDVYYLHAIVMFLDDKMEMQHQEKFLFLPNIPGDILGKYH